MKQGASGGFYFLLLPRKAQSGSGQEVTSIKEDLLMGWAQCSHDGVYVTHLIPTFP